MLEDFGLRVRRIRENKGISLNQYAKKLGVSSGYLSNLETGKTDKIPLTLLETLQKELVILPMNPAIHGQDDTAFRLSRLRQRHHELMARNSEAAEFLLASFEHGLDYFLNKE
ncbi:helix-turn-helix domain-containing protein [Peribacillus deserti]|uniref:Transcriptional regulator n=1 Tax=Peribacillus deserti TaxID=673318 RepID=A0A2N5M1F6_9BACI|nr:helix-turn-helix transcriptional regulator [Peribacillus deserti]PLT28197.1 transcriptional regulator [Peribacillus deserti]